MATPKQKMKYDEKKVINVLLSVDEYNKVGGLTRRQ
jgi:hypothetical protein